MKSQSTGIQVRMTPAEKMRNVRTRVWASL